VNLTTSTQKLQSTTTSADDKQKVKELAIDYSLSVSILKMLKITKQWVIKNLIKLSFKNAFKK
jgi:hypothetical protein